MRRVARLGLGLSLLLLLALIACLSLPVGQQHLLRPLLEQGVALMSPFKIRIGGLDLDLHHLQLRELRIAQGDNQIEIGQLTADWNGRQLRHRRLGHVRISAVTAEIHSAGREEPATPPAALTLPLDSLDLTEGALRLHLGDRALRLTNLALHIAPEAEGSGIHAQGRLGTPGAELTLDGRLLQRDALRLELTQVRSDGHPFLQRPLQIDSGAFGTQEALELQLTALDLTDLVPLLAAVQAPALPAALSGHLDNPQMRWRPTTAGWQLLLAAPLVQLGWQQRQLAATDLKLRLTQAVNQSINLDIRLKDIGPLHLHGSWDGHQGTTRGQLLLTSLEGLRALATEPIPRLDLPATLRWEGTGAATEWSLQAELREPAQKAAPLRLHLLAAKAGGAATPLQLTATAQLGERHLFELTGGADSLRWRLLPTANTTWQRLVPAGMVLPEFQGLHGEGTVVWDAETLTLESTLRGQDLAQGGFHLRQPELQARLQHTADSLWRLTDGRLTGQVTGGGGQGQLLLHGRGSYDHGAIDLRLRQLNITGAEFASEDGLSALSGGAFHSTGVAQGTRQRLAFDLRGTLQAQEVLQGAFYAETAATPLTWSAQGSWRPQSQALTLSDLRLTSPDLLQGQAKLAWSPTAFHATGQLKLPQLQGPLSAYARAALTGTDPRWADLALHGALGVDFDLSQQGQDWGLRSNILPSGLNIIVPHLKLELAGLDGRLPLLLGPALSASLPPQTGQLQLARLQLGPVQVAAQTLAIQSTPDHWQMPAIQAQLAAGGVNLTDLALVRQATGLGLAANLRITAVQLPALTAELGLPPMDGALSADLGRIRYDADGLRTEGLAQIDVFGGRITVGDIHARNLLSPVPVVQGNISLRGIDLAALTRTFSFGEMNGTLDGQIDQLQLAGNIPSRFNARLQTRTEGERNISVKALNNLSVISQGGFAGVLGKGVYQFINFYNYRRLGLACTLRNDSFHLTGTAREESDRYLIDGGWLPPKIDIIAPPGTISFKEMLSRIKRVDRGR